MPESNYDTVPSKEEEQPEQPEVEKLAKYMKTLLAAGFDIQYVLHSGYTAAFHHTAHFQTAIVSEYHLLEFEQRAADLVYDAAKRLGIASEQQMQWHHKQGGTDK